MKDIKVFGTFLCPGCIVLKELLDKKGVDYTFFDITDPDGLTELACLGLADELALPVVVLGEEKANLTDFTQSIESLLDKERQNK